ncbi:hypothetical protein SNEBB_010763 [Seison nebaliae]|nr:hypothetical protein SNEBB_010763 [Seison nebaliae]
MTSAKPITKPQRHVIFDPVISDKKCEEYAPSRLLSTVNFANDKSDDNSSKFSEDKKVKKRKSFSYIWSTSPYNGKPTKKDTTPLMNIDAIKNMCGRDGETIVKMGTVVPLLLATTPDINTLSNNFFVRDISATAVTTTTMGSKIERRNMTETVAKTMDSEIPNEKFSSLVSSGMIASDLDNVINGRNLKDINDDDNDDNGTIRTNSSDETENVEQIDNDLLSNSYEESKRMNYVPMTFYSGNSGELYNIPNCLKDREHEISSIASSNSTLTVSH